MVNTGPEKIDEISWMNLIVLFLLLLYFHAPWNNVIFAKREKSEEKKERK